MWTVSESMFCKWAAAGRPDRTVDSVKCMFDKLANVNKSTGDPSCTPNIQRSNRIARAILNRSFA